jgi:hypothetical protein
MCNGAMEKQAKRIEVAPSYLPYSYQLKMIAKMLEMLKIDV